MVDRYEGVVERARWREQATRSEEEGQARARHAPWNEGPFPPRLPGDTVMDSEEQARTHPKRRWEEPPVQELP